MEVSIKFQQPMRLFIAIELPEDAKEEMRKSQKQIPKAKLSLAKDFHITNPNLN